MLACRKLFVKGCNKVSICEMKIKGGDRSMSVFKTNLP